MKTIYYNCLAIITFILLMCSVVFISINFGIVGIETYENCTNMGTHYVCFPENYKPTILDLLFTILIILITILIIVLINNYIEKRKRKLVRK